MSDARIEALSLAIVDRLAKTTGLELADRGSAVRAVAGRLKEAFQIDEALDAAVRARIGSLRRPVPEGSREWDLLYEQYVGELSRRR